MGSISVIIPLFNKEPYVKRALLSVLAQTRRPDEIIVVDDGSTDGGGEIVKAFDNPLIKLIRQENQGASAARNKGISEAKGELIAFLDADDAWKPRFLEIVGSLRKKFPAAGAFATTYEIVTSTRSMVKYKSALPPELNEGIIENYFRVGLEFPVNSSSVMVPKQVLLEVGGFPKGERLLEDLDTWFRIALKYPIAWSREVLASYYLNAVNRTCNTLNFDREPIVSKTARQAIQEGQVPPEMIIDVREYAAHFQIDAARDFLVKGNKKLALEMLGYAKGTKRHAWWWWKIRLAAVIPGNLFACPSGCHKEL